MNSGSEPAAAPARAAGHGVFAPALLLALAVIGWSGFQAVQLVRERGNLQTAIGNQETRVEQSQKLRSRFESLATGLARLARTGNANATVLVEELRRRGFKLEGDDPQGSAPGSAPGP